MTYLLPNDSLLRTQVKPEQWLTEYNKLLNKSNCLMDEVIELLEQAQTTTSSEQVDRIINQVRDLMACTENMMFCWAKEWLED
jgi:hypothetical protein